MKALLNLLFILTAVNAFSQSTASVNVSTFTLHAPQLQTDKKIWLYLPEGYQNSNKHYPVVYMHDAQNLFDKSTSFSGEWRVDETLDSLKLQVIVVGIEHGNEKRIDELTPYKNEKYGGGKADAYLDFIVNTVKPHIDSLYRTKTKKKDSAIIGSSLGGLVSFYAVLKYPGVFGKAGVFSPAFWFTNDIYTLAEQAKKINTKIYFLAGGNESEEMVPDLQRMHQLIAPKMSRKNHTEKIIPEGKHNEALWAKQFPEAIIWLLK